MKSFKSLVLAFFLCFLFVSLVSARDKVILLNQGGGGSSSEWTLSGTGITPTTATSTAAGYTSNVTTGVFQFGTQASEGMRYSPVTGGGRLGIGTTAPSAAMEISPAGGTNIYDAVLRQSVDDKGLIIYGYDDRAANYIQIGIASTARATITTDQTWLYLDLGGGGYDWALTNTVFYAPPNGYIDANTSFALKFGATTTLLSTASAMKLTPTFGVTIDGSGIPLNVDKDGLVGTTVSGSRYKTNIVEASVGDHVYLMKPKSWDYRKRVPVYGEVKIDGTRDLLGYDYPDEASGYRKLGLIAEDLDAIDPRYINLREADGTAKNYDDRAVINALVQNAKDQKAEIDALQKAVADLANRLEALEAK